MKKSFITWGPDRNSNRKTQADYIAPIKGDTCNYVFSNKHKSNVHWQYLLGRQKQGREI